SPQGLLERAAHRGQLLGRVDVGQAGGRAAHPAELGLAHVIDADRAEEVAQRVAAGAQARLHRRETVRRVDRLQALAVLCPAPPTAANALSRPPMRTARPPATITPATDALMREPNTGPLGPVNSGRAADQRWPRGGSTLAPWRTAGPPRG